MDHYFKKENIANAVRDSKHQAIQFENLANGDGVIKLDDSRVDELAVLNDHADNRKGGVVRISPEIYESLKKNPPAAISQQRSQGPSILNQIRSHQNPDPFRSRAATSVAAASGSPLPVTDQDAPKGMADYKARVMRSSQLGGIRTSRTQ